jgi:hypothetical protein
MAVERVFQSMEGQFRKADVAALMRDGGCYSLQDNSGAWMVSIPKEHARDELGLEPGDQLAVVPSDDDGSLYEIIEVDD